MLYNILLVFEVLLAIALIALILMQQGKGADAGAAFGSGASGTVFGSRGAGNFLSRATAILATLFFVNCLLLAYLIAHRTPEATNGSVIDQVPAITETVTPVPVTQPENVMPAVPDGNSAQDQAGNAATADTTPVPPVEAPVQLKEQTSPATSKPADIPD
jgi:preprotein translocase subunit SecG